MSKRNFPSFIEGFLDYSTNVGAPHKFLLWSAISGISATLERKTWIVYNGVQVIYPNLYVMLIAESGVAKKSTATRALTEILYEVEDLHCMSTQLSAASLIEQLRDAGEKKLFEHDGKKFKNSSLFAYSSEAKVTIGDQKGLNGIQELLTDFYDCGDPNIWSDKKGWNKRTISGGDITIYNPCLNFLACSTPAWLNEAIGKSGIEGGFASRVIFVTQHEREKASVGWIDDEGDTITKKSKEMKELLVQDLKQISKIQGRYKTATGWKEAYNEIQKATDKKIDEATEMRAYYSRKMWHCMKLAQVLAADKSNELVVGPKDLMAANELLESLEPEMYSAFAMKGENRGLASLVLVWEIMRKRATWRKRDLSAVTYKHATGSQLDDHLRTLSSMGKIAFFADGALTAYRVIDPSPLGKSATRSV